MAAAVRAHAGRVAPDWRWIRGGKTRAWFSLLSVALVKPALWNQVAGLEHLRPRRSSEAIVVMSRATTFLCSPVRLDRLVDQKRVAEE